MVEYCKRKTGFVIDISIPTDNDISVKEYNNMSKYKVVEIEFQKNVVP